jgi:hypothetical protein
VPDRHRAALAHPVALIAGGAVGAVLRHGLSTLWPRPGQTLVTTVVVTACAFVVAGFVLTAGPMTTVRAAVLGVSVSAASLSAWAVLTITQTPLLSAAFLTLTPAAALGGLAGGLLLARATAP